MSAQEASRNQDEPVVPFTPEELQRFRDSLTVRPPTFSEEDFASLLRGIDEAIAGEGIPHEEAMRLVGLDP